jgi:hypothetical protein
MEAGTVRESVTPEDGEGALGAPAAAEHAARRRQTAARAAATQVGRVVSAAALEQFIPLLCSDR